MQAIIPSAGAQGNHTYRIPPSAASSTLPTSGPRVIDIGAAGDPITTIGRGIGSGSGSDVGSSIGVPADNPGPSSYSSISAGKRKYADITPDDISRSGSSSLGASSSGVAFKRPTYIPGKLSKEKTNSSTRVTSATGKMAEKVTPAIAISGMQGSVNRLADVFERTWTTAPTTPLSQAMALAQSADDGLSQPEVVILIDELIAHPVMAEAYLQMDEPIRRIWTQQRLKISGARHEV